MYPDGTAGDYRTTSLVEIAGVRAITVGSTSTAGASASATGVGTDGCQAARPESTRRCRDKPSVESERSPPTRYEDSTRSTMRPRWSLPATSTVDHPTSTTSRLAIT